jgi:hypothetical protein
MGGSVFPYEKKIIWSIHSEDDSTEIMFRYKIDSKQLLKNYSRKSRSMELVSKITAEPGVGSLVFCLFICCGRFILGGRDCSFVLV